MTLDDVLASLLAAFDESVAVDLLVTRQDAQRWPDGALKAFTGAGLLRAAPPAVQVECHGCEHRCWSEVVRIAGGSAQPARAFVICDHPELNSIMGRIQVPPERLRQWKLSITHIVAALCRLLGLEKPAQVTPSKKAIQLGIGRGAQGRRAIALHWHPFELVIAGRTAALAEILYFETGQLTLDRTRVQSMLDAKAAGPGVTYQSSTERRAARVQETQAMYRTWQDEFSRLWKQASIMGRTRTAGSIAAEIAKMPIAKGRSAETIRRHMKC